MGQEINKAEFTDEDFRRFHERLKTETRLLGQWAEQGRFDDCSFTGGFELEAWLLDPETLHPAARNEDLLRAADDPLLSPELARFNIELNNTPRPLAGHGLRQMQAELETVWQRTADRARELGIRLAAAGILPTARHQDFTLENMSAMTRYRALNEQYLRLREGRTQHLDIEGRERLTLDHPNVMLEAATTSFQIHLEVPATRMRRHLNAAMAASAPLVAAAANSPFLFGRDLWAETRIPLFEQAVELGSYALRGPLKRVSFGSGYLRARVAEPFEENLEHYPVLLPILFDTPPEELAHLRLHNGTIWRWNRLLVTPGQRPHLRLEQRVVPAGPTFTDQIANAALFFGLAHALASREVPPEVGLEFALAKQNFYQCARHGLRASIHWTDGKRHPVRQLLLEQLLPEAHRGLKALGMAPEDADGYIAILRQRIKTGRTGYGWQRAFVERHGADMDALTRAYLENQATALPVHEWPWPR